MCGEFCTLPALFLKIIFNFNFLAAAWSLLFRGMCPPDPPGPEQSGAICWSGIAYKSGRIGVAPMH